MVSRRWMWVVVPTVLTCSGCVRETSLPTSAAPEATPTAVAPKPDPTPLVIATPTPAPSATPVATSCPTLLGIRITVFVTQPERDRVILDATPLSDQCSQFPGRRVCPLGPAGTEVRAQCESVRIGADGPRWSIENGNGTVEPLPGSGYLASVIGRGLVTACSRIQPDVCASIEVR